MILTNSEFEFYKVNGCDIRDSSMSSSISQYHDGHDWSRLYYNSREQRIEVGINVREDLIKLGYVWLPRFIFSKEIKKPDFRGFKGLYKEVPIIHTLSQWSYLEYDYNNDIIGIQLDYDVMVVVDELVRYAASKGIELPTEPLPVTGDFYLQRKPTTPNGKCELIKR
jgi:hypothetical protein